MRGTAAQALLEYGSPAAADAAKAPLLKALAEADNSDKPQIAWALASLKATEAFDGVMGEYRLGHLAEIQKIDGSPAFDPDVLSGMVTLDKLASMAGDESDSVRQLVATCLARTGDAKWTDVLIKLVTDKQIEVAREGGRPGLGKIANEQAMQPLLEALAKADTDSRQKFLEALRDGVGAKGLVLALKSVSHDSPEREKFQTKQIFDMLRELEDPRGGDPLSAYIATNPKPHWKTEAALRLAEIGDVRAVPALAWRMTQDPLKLYNDIDDPELRRDDNERVVGARMLADLAIVHPEAQASILASAEGPVIDWITGKPQPHANGLRFLVAAGSKAVLPKLTKWADPAGKFPQPGSQPPMPTQWETAQSALRYLGWSKPPQTWPIFEKQLFRISNKKDTTVTMQGLMQGGLAIVGMAIRGLGVGASDGYAQWGDPRAYPILVKYIEDKENNEQSRVEACFALSWVATDDEMREVVKKVHDYNKADAPSQVVRACYLETLIHRPVPDATAGLIDLLQPNVDLEVRHQASRAIAFGGITRNMILADLRQAEGQGAQGNDAALALLDRRPSADHREPRARDVRGRCAGGHDGRSLKSAYNQTFGYWSDKNYDNGDAARWVENALAVQHVRVHDALQEWPKLLLSRALQEIEFDNGPHSITRVQFRYRLMQDAKGTNDLKREAAIEILKFMKEKGVLMALRSEPGRDRRAPRRPRVLPGHEPEGERGEASGRGEGGQRQRDPDRRGAETVGLPEARRLKAVVWTSASGLRSCSGASSHRPPASLLVAEVGRGGRDGGISDVHASKIEPPEHVMLQMASHPDGARALFQRDRRQLQRQDHRRRVRRRDRGAPVHDCVERRRRPTSNLRVTDPPPACGRGPEAARNRGVGFRLDLRDCPGASRNRAAGQNTENVFFEGLEPPRGHYKVEISLVDPRGALVPIVVRFGARIGSQTQCGRRGRSRRARASDKKTFGYDLLARGRCQLLSGYARLSPRPRRDPLTPKAKPLPATCDAKRRAPAKWGENSRQPVRKDRESLRRTMNPLGMLCLLVAFVAMFVWSPRTGAGSSSRRAAPITVSIVSPSGSRPCGGTRSCRRRWTITSRRGWPISSSSPGSSSSSSGS